MATDFRVSPPSPVPGQLPKAGQTTIYLHENGDMNTFWLTWVGPAVKGYPRRLECSGYLVSNGNKYKDATSLVANPVALHRDGWIFDLDMNCVKWCSCTAPFPEHCP